MYIPFAFIIPLFIFAFLGIRRTIIKIVNLKQSWDSLEPETEFDERSYH